jgi:predicted dinucleotide-binding enzyme
MKVGIIGAGMIGATLARHLVKLGHDVKLANSRGVEGVAPIAKDTGATAATANDAVRGAEVVVITIPQKAVADLPGDLFTGASADLVVVDTGNYYPSMRDGNIAAIDEGMPDSAWVAQKLGRPVIKAFNNIFFKSLDEKGAPPGTAGRVALPVAGDPPIARKVVMQLVDELGFDPIDAGPLSESWRQQPGTPGYCMDLDKAAATKALNDADPNRIREIRSEADENAKRIVARMKETGIAAR